MNHNGQEALALRLIDAAHSAGADAVKFQLFSAAEQISPRARTADYQRLATGHEFMVDMARTYDLPWSAHERLAAHCDELGIMYMSSCFDVAAVDFYHSIGGQVVKIASNEITNFDLLRHIAATGLPTILSTGMSSLAEIAAAVDQLTQGGQTQLALLHCVSLYPTPLDRLNLRYMATLRAAFGWPVGLSDHTTNHIVGALAVALGATIVEKHFTVDRMLPGPDHSMSCEPHELASYIAGIRDAETALGSFYKEVTSAELLVSAVARRSLVATRDLAKGARLAPEDLAAKRPAGGLEPRERANLVDRHTRRPIAEGEQITWADLE